MREIPLSEPFHHARSVILIVLYERNSCSLSQLYNENAAGIFRGRQRHRK